MKASKEETILYCSNHLFLQKGYESTTMRQIANMAEVSLGLATYHFKSKRQLAVQVLEAYLRYLKERVASAVDPQTQPLVHSAAMVRLSIEFFLSHPCRQFYLECLEQDIYMESIHRLGNQAMHTIARAYQVDLSPDLMLLYDNYIPPSVEKILLLEKQKGNFPSISYDSIPNIVFSISVERYLDSGTIAEASAAGQKAARAALAEIPPDLTQTLFASPSVRNNLPGEDRGET